MAHISSITKVQSSSATSVTITLTAGIAAGHTLIGGICWEAAAGTVPTISSIVDSRGNTWTTTPDDSVVNGVTLAVAVIRARATTALQVGDTVTITVSIARSKWAIQIDEFDDVNASSPKDQVAHNAPASATALTTGTTATTAQNYELMYVAFGFGSGRTITIPGGWSGGASVETTGGTDRALQTIWKYQTTAAVESGSLTLNTTSTYGGVIVTYKATSASPAVGRVSQVKFTTPQGAASPVARVTRVSMQAPIGSVGTVRVTQVKMRVPAVDDQTPYSGIKAIVNGFFNDASISAASHGAV
jgi:hypothetical protein